ncbi:hypothetical protein JCM17960_01230 [Magnetospira thiophila]
MIEALILIMAVSIGLLVYYVIYKGAARLFGSGCSGCAKADACSKIKVVEQLNRKC